MKAAVVSERGGVPTYADFPDPVVEEGKVLIAVEAVAVENVDRAIVDGTHYTADAFQAALPGIPCFDGIGRLPDGTLVGFGGAAPPYGTLAEWAIVPEAYAAPIPDGIAPEVAATLATAISAMSMRTAAGLKPGESVLIQGATGVAGRLAVQVARLLGAGRIVASGRDDAALQGLLELGADAVIDTRKDDDALVAAYRAAADDGLDVVLDFLWGRPTELLTRALVPDSFTFRPPVRLVQIGAAAGAALQLDAEALRTSGLEIYGASKGLAQGMADAYAQVVEWTRSGELTFDITVARLSDIESAWQRTDLRGSRLVVRPDRVIDERTSA